MGSESLQLLFSCSHLILLQVCFSDHGGEPVFVVPLTVDRSQTYVCSQTENQAC